MRKLLIVLAAGLFFVACAHDKSSTIETSVDEPTPSLVAENVFIGDLCYNLYDNKTAEVVRDDGYQFSLSGELTIPSTIEYNSENYSVTSIKRMVFYNCSALTSVTIPNSVTSIGLLAFYECTALSSPLYNEHIFAYLPDSYVGPYAIPRGITQISGGAFYSCTGLTSITIPNSVTSIEIAAFYNCFGLTSVTIPNSVTSIGGGAFYGTSLNAPVYNAYVFAYMPTSYKGAYAIPQGITQIAGSAFADCIDLTSVTIPNSVTNIEEGAFGGCTGLKYITIPNSVTNIGRWAFKDCTGLTSITIPKSVKSIADNAFEGCTNLQIYYEE